MPTKIIKSHFNPAKSNSYFIKDVCVYTHTQSPVQKHNHMHTLLWKTKARMVAACQKTENRYLSTDSMSVSVWVGEWG